jgi:hypothetical protein
MPPKAHQVTWAPLNLGRSMVSGERDRNSTYIWANNYRPDHCDGSYDSSCDPSRNGVCSRSSSLSKGHHGHTRCNRAYSNIHKILGNFGRNDLLEYMSSYWKGIRNDEHLWEHEWSKHGTCVSTLEPECYGEDYVKTEEVVDYFAKAVEIFQTLPTYDVRFFSTSINDRTDVQM